MGYENFSKQFDKQKLEEALKEKRNQRALHASGGDVEERVRLDEEIEELERQLYL